MSLGMHRSGCWHSILVPQYDSFRSPKYVADSSMIDLAPCHTTCRTAPKCCGGHKDEIKACSQARQRRRESNAATARSPMISRDLEEVLRCVCRYHHHRGSFACVVITSLIQVTSRHALSSHCSTSLISCNGAESVRLTRDSHRTSPQSSSLH